MKKLKNIFTPVLSGFARLNFASNFSFTRKIEPVHLGDQKGDRAAIKSDWEAVGFSMKTVMKEIGDE
ncbi:hypothetical protein [Fructobacillus ficulneus]|uniref:Uncharacterized protein n=1 Tax=Fructobacillus ficulneus TaxID=157463 RepID=A0A0K8MJF5_9LACO|nr:hypothetical protein [Fructobacillus ficulneus]GAO99989.1 hypothetical protein FFIC_270200 [Fructobacillus ficulneus]